MRNKNKKGATLYVRGTNESMKDLMLPKESNSEYSHVITYNKSNALKSSVFASRNFTEKEARELQSEFLTAKRSSIEQETKLSNLAKHLEANLEVEAIVGFKNSLKKDAQATVDSLRDMGVGVHILSGDIYEHCMMAVQSLGLKAKEDSEILLNFKDEASGRTQIKGALDFISDTITADLEKTKVSKTMRFEEESDFRKSKENSQGGSLKNKKIILVVSGECMETVKANRYLFEHFNFILEFSKVVVGYNMSPIEKSFVVSCFKNLERKTLAVGDGFNDVNMIQTASVGVQLFDQNVGYQFGDIVVDNILSIPVAMRDNCRKWNDSLQLVVHFIYNYSATLIFINLFYQIYNHCTGQSILKSYFITTTGFFSVVLGLLFIFFSDRYSKSARAQLPGIYCEKSFVTEAVSLNIIIFRLVPLALLEGAIILLLSIHVFGVNFRPSMEIESKGTLGITVHVISFLSLTLKLIVSSSNQKTLLSLFSSLTWAIMIGIIATLMYIGGLEPAYRSFFHQFFASWNILTLVAGITLFLLTFYYAYWTLVVYREQYPIHQYLTESFNRRKAAAYLPYDRFQFLQKFKTSDSFTTIFRKCFSSGSDINIMITNILLPSSVKNSTDKAIQKFSLRFNSILVEKKYVIYVLNKFILVLRITLLVGSIGALIYLITDYVLYKGLGDTDRLLSNIFIFLLITVVFFSTFEFKWSRRMRSYSRVFVYSLLIVSIIYCITIKREFSLLGTVLLLFVSLNYSISTGTLMILSAIGLAGFGIDIWLNREQIGSYLWNSTEAKVYPILSLAYAYFAITFAVIVLRYKNERLIKEEFLTGATLDSTLVMVKDLLSLLLPKFVLDRMQNFYEISGEKQVFDDEDSVSIMFCDIADFDDVVKKNEGNIVSLLDKIFRKFDDLCLLHGIQKIETVGKTYMAAAGLKAVEACLSDELKKLNPTLRTVNFAKDMMSHIEEYPGLNLKIGVHVGKPVMGVIGYHKPQFSLIGDVVNTTSRHCTTGKKGHIMLSQAAWEKVEHNSPESFGYKLEIIPTEMKGKGSVSVYHLYKTVNHFMVHLQSIISKKDQYETTEKRKMAEVMSKMMEKVVQMKRRNKEGGNRLIQLIAQLRSSKTLGNLYSRFSPQNQPTIMKDTEFDPLKKDEQGGGQKPGTQVLSSGNGEGYHSEPTTEFFTKETDLFDAEEDDAVGLK